ncbi:MAG: cupin domain-containing protein [Hyphococcus sp.]
MDDKKPESVTSKPFLVSLEQGKRYAWCACGRSHKQPFCDGSHAQTGIDPIVFTADRTEEVLLCGCKKSRGAPFCDGTHNNLDDSYELASPEEIEATKNAKAVSRDGGAYGKAPLDGGAFVLTADPALRSRKGGLTWQSLVSREDGARHLHLLQFVATDETPWRVHHGGDTALYVIAGRGVVNINGASLPVAPETGVFIRAGEPFRLQPEQEMQVIAAISPDADPVDWPIAPSEDSALDNETRCVRVDIEARNKMADRFYQVLVGEKTGSVEMTQFIGEVPKSRAAFHRHLYEEAIVILSGEGVMWTRNARTDVKPGDVIFLPPRQEHSLECTADAGMRLLGVFYPAGSPAINY